MNKDLADTERRITQLQAELSALYFEQGLRRPDVIENTIRGRDMIA